MSRILVMGGRGVAAALVAKMALEANTLGIKPSEVILVDDSLPPSEGDDSSIKVISTNEAKKCFIIGAGNYASQFPIEQFTVNCVEPYVLQSAPDYANIRQSRPQGRHPFDRKQQSMQAKARRR